MGDEIVDEYKPINRDNPAFLGEWKEDSISLSDLGRLLRLSDYESESESEYEVESSYQNVQSQLIVSDDGMVLCPDCPTSASPELGAILYETIEETGSPALAIQAIKTAFASMIYHHQLPVF